MARLSKILSLLAAAATLTTTPVWAQTAAPAPTVQASGRDRLIAHLTGLGAQQTAARRAVIAGLSTAEDARQRQVRVRSLLAEMIEFETAVGPVVAETTGSSREDGFTLERVSYQSLPDYWVTADLFLPEGRGPHPAVIIQPGHGVDGKVGNFGFSALLARAGFVVLSLDIVGEGERIQHFDPEIGASKVGRPTGEHSMAFGQALPVGGHVSRWFILDAIRGVDYLMARPEVDDQNIGAFGCSGGGTITTYLAAIDPRIKATATACYANDFDHLLAPGGPGPQDAEQSIPFFLERGLDLPDWIEAAAPRPYAVVATTEDMFPIAGARAAYEEARRFYGLMGAADKITLIEGPGGHGALGPITPQIIDFFSRNLLGRAAETPGRAPPVGDVSRLLVTPTGQLSTSGVGVALRDVIRAEAEASRPQVVARETPAQRLARLRVAIADITRPQVGRQTPPLDVRLGEPAEGGARSLAFEAAPGMTVNGRFMPAQGRGDHPTLLLLTAQSPTQLAAAGGAFDAWTKAGWNVLWIEPRGAGGTEEVKSPLTGDWTLLSLRALLVGRTPIGMRADDAALALRWLKTRRDVDEDRITIMGVGALGPVALHTAIAEDGVDRVIVENAVLSYREFTDRPISRDMAEINLPGVLRRYDLPDLMATLGDRLTLVNPVNSIGQTLSAEDAARLAPEARLSFRSARDPITPPPAR